MEYEETLTRCSITLFRRALASPLPGTRSLLILLIDGLAKICSKILLSFSSKGSPPEIVSRFKGALPEWGGGVSTLARMVWGT